VDAARLHRPQARKERGETLIEGPHLLADAVAAGVTIKTVFALAAVEAPVDTVLVDDRALARLAGTESPRGPVAVIEIPQPEEPGEGDLLISYGISDPGNVGTLIRTAASFGWSFGYTKGSADPWSPKVLRSGAGGQFHTQVIRLGGLPDIPVVAAVVTGGGSLTEVVEERVAVLIGEEAAGLPAAVADGAKYKVTIPTTGPTQSLNAAVASGIIVYELSKRKRIQVGQV